MRTAAFAAAARLWCVHEAMKLWLIPGLPVWQGVSWLVVLAAAARPSAQTFSLALSIRLADSISLMPLMWDSYYWCLLVDGGLLLLLVYLAFHSALHSADAHADSLAEWWATTARQQLATFYLAAAAWKLNTSFLLPTSSCAPIFFITLLQTLGLTPSPSHAAQLALVAPAVTIAGELTIGVLLLLPSRAIVRLGVLIALALHLGIALTPPPNNATPFSLACVVRLLVTESAAVSRVLSEMAAAATGVARGGATSSPAVSSPPGGLGGVLTPLVGTIFASVCMAICYRRAAAFPPSQHMGAQADWWVGAYAFLAVVGVRALYLDAAVPVTSSSGDVSSASFSTSSKAPVILAPRALRPIVVVLAILYAFGGPLTGLHDLGACNMYSNLRMCVHSAARAPRAIHAARTRSSLSSTPLRIIKMP